MQFSTARSKIVAVTATLLVAATGLVGAAAVATETGSDRDSNVPALDVPAYAGDPWEKRFREQFWTGQHIHDSWNRCHLGENVPRSLHAGPGC